MSELKSVLEQLRDQLLPLPESFERLVAHRRRRRRNQRLVASAFALIVATAGVALAVRALGPTRGPQPVGTSQEGVIAFSRGGPDGGIYVMKPDGTGFARLTNDPGDDQAAWSRDGSEIAFVRSHRGNEDIYVMHSDGSGVRRLTTDGASSSPTWSPDGTRIAFARETSGNADIYVMNRDGTHVTRLTRDTLLEYTPAWSPDGSKIAFLGYSKGPPPSPTRLYVMKADGSNVRQIGPDNAAHPSWSPDGAEIAFVNEDSGSIYVMGPDGTGLRRVVDVASLPGDRTFEPNFTFPAWSPDGGKILFAAGDATSSHLFIANADGSGLVQLTHGAVFDEDPAWSSLRSSPTPSETKEVIDMSFGDGTVWALTCDQGCTGDQRHSTGRALRIDPTSGRILASVALNDPWKIAVGEGGVWVISFWNGTVTRIDPVTSQVVATIKLKLPFAVCETCPDPRDFLPYDVAVGEGAVWVDTGRGVLDRIDPGTNEVAAEIRLPGDSTGEVTVGEGAVWVTETVLGVYRIDPATNEITAKITTDDEQGRRLSVDQVTVGGGAVFVQGAWARKTTSPFGHVEYVLVSGAALARIDPASNRSVAIFPVGDEPRFMAFDSAALWLWRLGGSTLERIDPQTGSVKATVDAPAGGHIVAVGQGYGWVAMPDGTLTRMSLPTG